MRKADKYGHCEGVRSPANIRTASMRKALALVIAFFFATSCTSVITGELMDRGIRDFSLNDLVSRPEAYQGRLFIFGGIIANTTVTNDGSLVEALFVPVDSLGNLKDMSRQTARFLALYPQEKGVLDPVIYRKDGQVTIAGTFRGVKTGRIDRMDYVFPEFVIDEIYLWEEPPRVQYVPGYYVPYGGWSPYWGPYWSPFLGPPLPYRHYRR